MKSTGLMGCLSLLLLLFGVANAKPSADGIFTDVPRGHWAYESVRKATEAGVLQGYDGKFHGNKTINRYQMALIVARMLEKLGRGGDAMKNLSEQDLQNLEALTIEFADELALLNVKVSTLEDNFAELKHDVEAIKTGGHYGGRHGRGPVSAGLHGVTALRLVMTDANGPAGAVGNVGATHTPLTRYGGDVVGAVGAQTFTARTFFTIPYLSLSVDRAIDEGIGMHLQIDLDGDIADNQNTPGAPFTSDLPGGNGQMQVNEAYIDVDDFFYGVGARLGAFALPVSREHNGTHRTLDYTITPSAVSWRLESYRPIGVEFRNQDDVIRWDWRLSVFSGLDGPSFAVAGAGNPNFVNGMLMPTLDYACMKGITGFPVNVPYNDTPIGLNTATVGTEVAGFGYFARVGDQPDEGFGWDLNYLASGGNITPSTTKRITSTDFSWIAGSLDYYWKYFDIVVQVYQGTTKNTATTGQITNAAGDAVASLGAYGLFNYRFDPDNNFTLRYEQATDDVKSIGKVDVTALTVGYNRIISDHSLFQLEYLTPAAKYTAATPLVAGSMASNTTDQKDALIQANYKLKW
ncbi:MAG: S-layer homology domain-containing protein [Candidatus Riflebacteria bacterium]|nr:S-layer homology domain-containing protein [Candidatus Riflebacteria bacterium]